MLVLTVAVKRSAGRPHAWVAFSRLFRSVWQQRGFFPETKMQRADEGAGASLGMPMTTVRGRERTTRVSPLTTGNVAEDVLLLPEFKLVSAEHAKQKIPVKPVSLHDWVMGKKQQLGISAGWLHPQSLTAGLICFG